VQLVFEWDEDKAAENERKHGVPFSEAKSVFNDPFSLTMYDPDHSADEERFVDLGMSAMGRLLIVSYTERAGRIRLISSRRSTTRERITYEKRE